MATDELPEPAGDADGDGVRARERLVKGGEGGIEASAGEVVSELTASRDVQAMVKAELLTPRGETRGRYYVGSPSMLKVRDDIRAGRPLRNEYDPFVVAADALQLSLDTG